MAHPTQPAPPEACGCAVKLLAVSVGLIALGTAFISPHISGPSRSVPLICADVQQAKAATSQQDALETAVKDLTVAVQRLSVCLFVCLLVCLPACLPVSLSVCLV